MRWWLRFIPVDDQTCRDAVVGGRVSAVKTRRERRRTTQKAARAKETLADRVEKVVGIVMTEEEKARTSNRSVARRRCIGRCA
jgi:hypothetical protein